jgi:hypothetical protein
MRKSWYLIFLVIVGIITYFWLFTNYFKSTRPTAKTTPAAIGTQPTAALGITQNNSTVTVSQLNDYVKKLNDTYRLKPDQRFINAIAKIHVFLTGKPEQPVTIEFTHDHWQLSYQQTVVGQLPEYPDFPDLLQLLITWTQQLEETSPIKFVNIPVPLETKEFVEAQLSQFWASHLITATHRLNTLWTTGTHTVDLLPYATQALIGLVLQQHDELAAAEQLPTQAITLLALSKTFANQPLYQSEALLAYILGYSAHARTVALNLAVDNPVRLYVYHRGEQLKTVAENTSASPLSRYLYLLWIARQKNVDNWKSWLERYFQADNDELSLIFKTGLILGQFGISPYIAKTLPYITVLALVDEVNKVKSTTQLLDDILSTTAAKQFEQTMIELFLARVGTPKIMTLFEEQSHALIEQHTGPFLTGEVYAAYFRGYFYSGLYRLGLHYLDALSSTEATTQYAKSLGEPDHPIAMDFQHWYQNLAKSTAGQGDPQRLIADLTTLKYFGVPPRLRTLEEQQRYFSHGDPELLKGVRTIVPYLDTRTSHRYELLNLAYSALLDLPLTEKLGDSIINTDPAHFQKLHAWLGKLKGDSTILMTLLEQPDLTFSTQLKVLNYLKELGQINAYQLEQAYEKVWYQAQDDWAVVKRYVDFLLDIKQFAKLREVGQVWLEKQGHHPSLKPVIMRARIARSYLKEGLVQPAWQTIKPIIATYQRGAMQVGADTLEAMGKLDQAEQLFRAAYKRYPDIVGQVDLTTFYWRHGRYQEAAEVLAQQRRPKNKGKDWRFKIGQGFVETFADQTDVTALEAYHQLLQQNIDNRSLGSMVVAVAQAKRFKLAEKMLAPLKFQGLEQMLYDIRRYTYRKAFEGEIPALAWLNAKIPPTQHGPLIVLAYDKNQYELLWDLIQITTADRDSDFSWLMRTSAYLKMGQENEEYYQQLQHYYAHHPHGHYNTIGRYLLHKADEAEIFALMKSSDKAVCETAYYIGLRAQHEGDYQTASQWYRVAIETGLTKNGEYHWAYDQLHLWYSNGLYHQR